MPTDLAHNAAKPESNDANLKDLKGSLISQLAPLMNDATDQGQTQVGCDRAAGGPLRMHGHIQPLSTDFEVFEVFAVCIFLLG
jgi:hypothetical protein